MNKKGVINGFKYVLGSVFILAFLFYAVSVFAVNVTINPSAANVNEDISSLYNFTISNTNVTANVTQVNITADGLLIDINTNGTSQVADTIVINTTLASWSNSANQLIINGTSGNFWFNATASTPGNYNFTIEVLDEAGIINTTVVPVTVNDTTNPSSIEFVSPSESDNSNLSRSNIVVNVTAIDNGVISTILIELFNSTNNLVGSASSSTSPNFYNFTGLGDGVYYFNATVNDTYNNINFTSTRTITLDTTYPLIDYGVGTESNNANVSQSNVYVNVSVTEVNEANITFNLYNSTGEVNSTTYTDGTRTINWTSLPDGAYTYNVTVGDYAGNINFTSTRTITLDTTAPVISAPGNATLEFTTDALSADFNATDSSSLDTWSVSDATNFTIDSSGLLTNNTALAVGIYSIVISVNDTYGNTGTSAYEVNVSDTTAPVISLISPADSTSSTTSAYNFTFNVSDDQTISNCSLIFDGSIINTLTSVNNSGGTNGMYNSSLSIATHTWSVNCTDLSGNVGNSSARTLIVSAQTTTTTTTSGGGGYPDYKPREEELNNGYQKIMGKNWEVSFKIAGDSHNFKLEDISEKSVKVIISSETQEATLSVGEEKKFELSGDNYYDILVKLNSIDFTNKLYPKANITIKTIHEEIIPLQKKIVESPQEVKKTLEVKTTVKRKTNLTWLWVVISLAVIVLLIASYKKLKK